MAKRNTPSVVDPTVRTAKLEVCGKTYKLCFDFNAIAHAEEETGLNILGHLSLTNLNAITFRALLWASLLKFQPEMTITEAGDLITKATLANADVSGALIKAFSDSSPEPEPEPKNVPTPETND